jgi:DNA mismatch endonuclease, patch repair protein
MAKIRNYQGRNYKKTRKPDLISRRKRSALMSKIRSRGTKFEIEFIKSLKGSTQKKFRTNVKSILGCPDIVFKEQELCVFLDSDFWHGWQYPRWKHLLKDDFWREKIERNRARDRKVSVMLRKNGWIVKRIWEHSIKENPNKSLNAILRLLKKTF